MNKKFLIVGGIIVLVLLLGAAAFIGGRLLNGRGLTVVPSGGSGLRLMMNGGQPVSLDVQPAKNLPQTTADVKGIFDHRQDNSIFVGTGKVMMLFQKDQSGNMKTSASHDGPTVEAVITSQTVIYRDVTMDQFNGNPPAGQKMQQVVETGSVADIGQGSMITIWGQKTGDRIIASVLVYTLPPVITK